MLDELKLHPGKPESCNHHLIHEVSQTSDRREKFQEEQFIKALLPKIEKDYHKINDSSSIGVYLLDVFVDMVK